MTKPQSLGFHRSPDILKPLVNLRVTRNKCRKITDELIPQLIEFERLIPDIFSLDSLAGQANRQLLIDSLSNCDVDSIQLLVNSYKPYFDAQRQLEMEIMLKSRRSQSSNDLPRKSP